MRRFKIVLLMLILLSMCGCSNLSFDSLDSMIDETVSQTLRETIPSSRSNKKDFYRYYLPASIGRRDSDACSDILVVEGKEILMSLNVSNVISDKYYINMENFHYDKVNENADFSRVYSYLDNDFNLQKFSVNLYSVDDSYYLQIRFRYFDYLCRTDLNSIPLLIENIIRVGRTAESDQDAVIAAYSEKEVINYVQQQSIFSQNIPENGTLEQMLVDYYPVYQLEEDEGKSKDSEEFYHKRSENELAEYGEGE